MLKLERRGGLLGVRGSDSFIVHSVFSQIYTGTAFGAPQCMMMESLFLAMQAVLTFVSFDFRDSELVFTVS